MKKALTIISGIFITILAFLGLKRRRDEIPVDLDKRAKELERKLEKIEEKEKALEEGIKDLDDKDVVDYWEDKWKTEKLTNK